MKKKFLALLLVVALVAALAVGLTACNKDDEEVTLETIKIGLICLHDQNSTYDKNFISAMEEVQKALGLSDDQVIIATGIAEGDACYQKACELADEGCDIIFADSFGHESYMIKAAEKYPEVQFCHATGTQAAVKNLSNYHNAFASIYEGRYLAGVAAGLKLVELYGGKDGAAEGEVSDANAKIGYVGAFTYAEVISGYTSFYLGVKSIVSNVTMEVTFTGSWYDETAENQAATNLITNRGCKLISQHADSMGAPNACEAAGIPDVSYNGSTASACPNTFIVSSRINWAPYYTEIINSVIDGKEIAANWTGTIATDSVQLTAVGTAAAAGTQAKLDEVKAELQAGTRKVFDTSTFTVTKTDSKNTNATVDNDGHLTAYLADVDGDYVGDTNVVENGCFNESAKRSAPYFDVQIDGITLLDVNFG